MKCFFSLKNLQKAFFLCVFILVFQNNGRGQVSYLGLDGGLEGAATIDNTSTYAAPQTGFWAKANATQNISNETTTVRTGLNSLKVNNSSTTGRRVWSPNISVSSTTSSVTVQFYRRVTSLSNTQESQAGIINNTEGLSGAYSVPAAINTWEKITYNKASSTFSTISGLFLHRQIGTGGDMFIDDMCIYTGAVDNTAPNSPGALTVNNPTLSSLDLSWGAAAGGVDGGGYIVVRGLADPTTAPNINGIYAVNNLIAAGMTVIYQGTGTSFTDAGLASSTTYYYRVYTYDKAYNYSGAVTGNGITSSATSCTEPTAQPTSLILTPATSTQINGSFTASASANGYIVVASTSSTLSADPADATNYSVGNSLGGGTVVAVGSSLTFNATGLVAGTQYYFYVFAYNSGACSINYLTSSASLQGNAYTYCATPSAQPTALSLSSPSATQIDGSYTASASANGYLVVISTSSTMSANPADGTTYVAGNALGGGTVVYAGTGTAFSATGLTGGTQYYFYVFAYNSGTCPIKYLTTSPLIGNSYTQCAEPTAQPTSLVLTPTSSTNIDGSFTASASATGYIIIRSTSSTLSADPVDGVTYSSGNPIGGGNVVGTPGASTTFSSGGLAGGTLYYYFVFAYNSGACAINYLTSTASLTNNAYTFCTQPANPSALALTTSSPTQIDGTYSFGAATGGIILMNTTGAAPSPTPVDGTTYSVGNSIGGCTVVAVGSSASFSATGLTTGILYYFYAFASNESPCGINYTSATTITQNSYTQCTEPTAQPTVLTLSTASTTSISGSFTASASANSYIIIRSTSSTLSANPVDGNIYATGNPLGGGTVVQVGASISFTATGLTANTLYYFFVYAYNSGTCAANYFTSTAALTNSQTTASGLSDVITANGESATISSLINDVATLTSATGVQVWQFTVRDGGSLNNDVDNLPTIVSGFTLTQNAGNQIDNWLDAIKTIAVFDGATWIANASSITTTTVVFNGLSINVPDNTNKTLTIRLSLNCPLNNVGAGNLDGDDFVFNITNANFSTPTNGTSSTKSAFATASSINGQNAVSIVATQLSFIQQPSNTGSGQTMVPSVTVAATDACGSIDINYAGTVSLTSSGTMTVTPMTANFSSGVATFTPIIHSVAETGVSLTATLAGLTSATSNTFEITTYTAIPDNGCATSNFATSIINYTNNLIISDVNVGVKVSHTFRGDLNVYLVGPDATTTVLLIARVGSSADNIDGIVDDQAAANQFSIVTNHVLDGIYDVNGKTEGAGSGVLSTFNGLTSLGNWTLKICDAAGVDIGGLISWELFITGTSPCAYTAGAITGAPFSVNCSTGSTGTIAYSSACTFTGNTFTAQLSNAAGSFSSPTNIGTLVSDVNTGNINITIPSNTITGAGYLIRILSTSPAYTSSSSAAFTITNTAPCSITAGAITGAPFNVNCSTAATGTIAFTSTATYSGNTYTAQLSDAAGSFTTPTNIGTLVSDANSGTVNITIPAGIPSGAGYLIRIISNSPSVTGNSSSSFTITLSGGPCQAFEIQSILVDACGNPEGGNEMVRFQVGGAALNTSNITVTWPNAANSWRGICQSASTAATVASINSTITGGGMLVEPSGGVIPANAQVMFFTSTSFSSGLYDFTALNYTLYAIFQCSGNTAGHFVNYNSTNPTNRTLTMNFTGFGTDAVTYNAYYVYNGDGGAVDFTPPGVPTYGSTGGCKAPMFPLPIELLSFTGKSIGKKVLLSWATASELNNDYFTIERSADAANFEKINIVDAAGNSTHTVFYSTVDEAPLSGISYYRLKQTDFDGRYAYSNIVFVDMEKDNDFQILNIFNSIENGSMNVTVNCSNNCLVNFELYDMTGKKVFSSNENITGNNRNISIPTNNLSSGIYLLKVYNGEKLISKKVKL